MLGQILPVLAFSLALILPTGADGQEVDCLKCHAKLKREKTVHAALEMACISCHTGINAKSVPHKNQSAVAGGLSIEQPELCYGCHDEALFMKSNLHAALGMGCTACHNPHSSKNAKLLSMEVPDLCFGCHDKALFAGKIVHAPVAGGMCLSCHTPHSSEEAALLLKKPYDLCLDCHAEVSTKQHASTGFGPSRHFLGGKKLTKKGGEVFIKDPSRPDRAFYCGSCHEPHRAEGGRLFRFGARSSMSLCTHCHKM